MRSKTFHLPAQIYYEDTDFSGVVYHGNYLRYFERARDHAIGIERLQQLIEEDGYGFVVYKIDLTYSEGAVFGDILDIRSAYEMDGQYRMNWHQEAWRPGGKRAAVKGIIQLVCINKERQLIPIPVLP